MVRSRLAAPILVALLALAPPAAAQRALGIGGDAATLPSGMLRITAGSLWDRANERYDADGKLRALGASASTTSWNGLYDDRLAAANPLVRTLAGEPSFDASLGALNVGRRDASADGLIGVELGLLSRLTIGAQARVASHAIEPFAVLNPNRMEGTMGFNPAWANTVARGRNTLLVTQFDTAVAQMTRRIAQCQATPATTGCSAITANIGGAQSLVANASAFATALNMLYGGRKNAAGLPFVPVANSAAHKAIDQRVLGYRDQFVALGNSAIGTEGPAGAALFSPANMATLLTDSLYGYLLRPLRTVHAYGLGDVSVHAKVRVFQTIGSDTATLRGFGLRQSVAASVRLSGGNLPEADEPFAPMTGTGGAGFSAQSFTDLFYGRLFSASIVVGFDQSQAQSYEMRIPAHDAPTVGGSAFPLQMAWREVPLSRTPGTRLDLSVTPRVALTRNIWLGATWSFASQAADIWQVTPRPDALLGQPDVTDLDVQSWVSGTDWSEQRLSLGGTYSTVLAARQGRAKRAFDVSYEHVQTISGSGWRVSHLSRDVVTLRWYPRVWGR